MLFAALRRAKTRRLVVRAERLESRSLLSGSLSGIVYDDLTGNGPRPGPADIPLAGQTVELHRFQNPGTVLDRSTVTGANGRYVFSDLPDGVYQVRWVGSAGRLPLWWDAGTRIARVPYTDSQSPLDFFTYVPATVSGTVFDDLDRDGTRDTGEPPLTGRVVFQDYDNDARADSPRSTTDANGVYRLEKTSLGSIRIRLEPLDGWIPVSAFRDLTVLSGGVSTGNDFPVMRPLAVDSLTLIDAVTDRPIGPLSHGGTIDLAQVGKRLNVRADVAANLPANVVGSVRFNYDGRPGYRIDNAAPFALAGNVGDDFISWTPRLGAHSLVVTAYGGANATGEQGPPLLLNFTVVDSTPARPSPRNDSRPRYRPVGSVAPGPFLVDAGSAAPFTDSLGRVFDGDEGFTGGAVSTGVFEVRGWPDDREGTHDDPLLATYRYGRNFTFSRPVVNGNYSVFLTFVEPVVRALPGRRLIDVFAEERIVVDDFDVVKEAGAARTAVAANFDVRVADGTLDLSFAGNDANALVSSIAIFPTAEPTAVLPFSIDRAGDTARAVRSQSNLRIIGQGVQMYANEHKGRFAPDLKALSLNGYLDTILPFANPRAGTHVPRGELSGVEETAWVAAHDDYVYMGAGRKYTSPANQALAYDNPSRVAGAINVLFNDGHVEQLERAAAAALIGFDPAPPAQPPTFIDPFDPAYRPDRRAAQSRANLYTLGRALQMHANENRGRLPFYLARVYETQDVPLETFVNPRGDTPLPPADLTDTEKLAWVSRLTDYGYSGAGGGYWMPSDVVIAYENPSEMKDGIFLLFADGRVEFREMRWAIDTIRRSIAWNGRR